MEVIIGIVVVVVLLIIFGKLKGAPEPTNMSEAAIFQRLQTEMAWISKYLSQPLVSQQSESLKRMYDEKTEYIKTLKAQLVERQVAQGTQAVNAELNPILARAAELVKEGKSEIEARATALKEWGEKDK